MNNRFLNNIIGQSENDDSEDTDYSHVEVKEPTEHFFLKESK